MTALRKMATTLGVIAAELYDYCVREVRGAAHGQTLVRSRRR